METTIAKGLNTALIAELKQESAKTIKMIERVPMDKPDWKPHDKSMALGRLTMHVIDMYHWVTLTINQDELDFAKSYNSPKFPDTNEELVEILEKNVEAAISVLEGTSDEELSKPWSLRNGEHIYFTMPKKVVLRDMCYNHITHHRGQLSVYLRLLNIPIPGMYGPSADDMEAMKK
jgi:uncharacterized damage-inducible protein DinB